jgi:hypothetical protein
MSAIWWLAATPRSAAAARSAPHSHAPAGKCGTRSSRLADQARCDPGAPGCLPGLRPPLPRPGLAGGGVRPGRSSALGAIEELPLLRPSRRRRSRTSAASATTSARSSPIAAACSSSRRPCSAITASRAAHDAQPGAGGGRTAITGHLHRQPSVITRHAGPPPRRAARGQPGAPHRRTAANPSRDVMNVYEERFNLATSDARTAGVNCRRQVYTGSSAARVADSGRVAWWAHS